jgi:hypothetical protein
VDNICLLCRAHNAYLAEHDYGKEFMERFRNSDSRVSEPAGVYIFSNQATHGSPPGPKIPDDDRITALIGSIDAGPAASACT